MTAKEAAMFWLAVALVVVVFVAAAVEFALELGVARRAVSPVRVRARVRHY
jgi:hypothetical protein